jgi:hypothetical protein
VKQLREETQQWQRMAGAVGRILAAETDVA